ncbi:unnamed protein product [Coregonus sp. 'balchen']|nr:unnamed protein product [Coregonus sp. 'balchen']
MDSLRRFQDDGYKNWIKTTMGLNCLKTRLGGFLENETETYHCELRKKIPKVCKEEVCEQWKVAILANHKGGPVYWNNSNPYLWPTKKWEVAKLGRALETHSPELRELAEEIEQLQNTDFSFIVNQFGKNRAEGKAAGNAADEGKIFEDMQKLQKFLSLEQQILKEKMECLTQRYEEDRETALTVDELQCVRVFLEGNKDLQESLGPQWEKLREFATEVLRYKNHLYEEANMQGWRPPVFSEIKEGLGFRGCVKVRGLTFEGTKVCGNLKASHQEVAKLALQHLSQLASDSASLSELANDTEEGEVASSQTDQPQSLSCTGPMFFGCVTVVLKTDVTSGERHSGKTEAVEFAYKKLALLLDLPESASPYKDVVLEHCHTQDVPPPEEALQSDAERRSYHCTLRFTGPITFYAPEGSRKKKPVQQQAAKVALQRLSWVLGSKEVVGGNYVSALKELLEAQTPPLEMPDYDVTDRGEGAGEVTERGGGVEESEGMTSEIEKGGIGKKEKGVWPDEGEGCPHIPPAPVIPSLQPPESQVVPVSAMDTSVTMDPMDTMVTMDTVVAIDTTVTMNTMETQGGGALESDPRQATPTLPEERSVFSDSRRFFACVTVYVQKDLIPQEASTQEGALQAAYCSLLQGLSLELPPTAGSERQSVLEFFRLAESDPPVEDCVTTAEGKHRCTLGIVGELTFHSPEAAPKKQQAEHWAAKEALRRLNSGPPPPKRSAEMKSGGETEEIRRCLVRWDLQPPCVVCEDVSVEQWCEWRVEVRLDRYTFHNQTLFSSKKEAIRRSYHSLGTTGEICQPGTDESQSMGKVKQFFLQRSFPLPVEDVKEQEKGRFCCTLKHITCVFTYSGQGSSEAAARQSACQRALSQLAPFIGNCGPVAPTGSTEKAVQRLQILLEGAGLTSANSALTGTQYRSSIQLRFSGYSMETRGQGNKKTIRAQLIQRLLGLLGEDEMDSSRGTSVRNVLDEWFVKRGLEKPGFEENTCSVIGLNIL